MIDRSLLCTILQLLREQKDLAGGTMENALFDDVNLRATVSVMPSLLREHLLKAEEKDWISSRLDALRTKRWRITPNGENALKDLQMGA